MEFFVILIVVAIIFWLVSKQKTKEESVSRRKADEQAQTEPTARPGEQTETHQIVRPEVRARATPIARSGKPARAALTPEKRGRQREQTPEDVRVMAELQKENTEEAQRKEDFRKLNVSEGRQGKPIKPASPYSSEPKLDPSLLRKLDTSEGYSKLGGRDSAWN